VRDFVTWIMSYKEWSHKFELRTMEFEHFILEINPDFIHAIGFKAKRGTGYLVEGFPNIEGRTCFGIVIVHIKNPILPGQTGSQQ